MDNCFQEDRSAIWKNTIVGAHFLYLTTVQGFWQTETLRMFKNSDTRSIWEVKKMNDFELNSFFLFLFTSPWISSAKEQVEKTSRIQGEVRCSSQDTVCIKCGDKKVFLPPMSVNNFLKAVFESCYVVFVALRVVKSVYILSSQNVIVKLTNVYTGEMHLSGWFIDSAELEKKTTLQFMISCLGYIEALPTSLFCNVSVLWRCLDFWFDSLVLMFDMVPDCFFFLFFFF